VECPRLPRSLRHQGERGFALMLVLFEHKILT
jgi:hypothetical protein